VEDSWIVGNPNDRSVTGFCHRHGSAKGPMGRSFYNKLKKRGLGPRETVIGGKTLISAADEAAWDEARANPVGDEAKLVDAVKKWRHRRALKAGAAAVASSRHVSKRRKK
jgi:hypothetical protein